MSRYIGPRVTCSSCPGSESPWSFSKNARQTSTRPVSTARGSVAPVSNYGKRLKEKQKLRAHYGVDRKPAPRRGGPGRPFAQQRHGDDGGILERRLDSVVFRAGLARTIPAAGQLVTHGHISVNGKRLSYPSARVNQGDVIGVQGTRGEAAVRSSRKWVRSSPRRPGSTSTTSAMTARVSGLPGIDSVPFPVELPLVVEFYS